MQNTFQSPIERACSIVGGQSAMAKHLSVTPAAVNQWVKGARPVPARHCPSIESLANGNVTRQDLRPGDWMKFWPELKPSASIKIKRRTQSQAPPE